MKTLITITDQQITIQVDNGEKIVVPAAKQPDESGFKNDAPDDSRVREKVRELDEAIADHQERQRPTTMPASTVMMPTKGVIRKCIVCGKVLEPYNRTKFCSENCKKARKKEYNARWRAHTLTDNQKAWNTYGEFKNQPIAKPNEHPKTDGVFTDPWDCLVCRNAGDLCTLHEGMEAKGMKPAQYKHPEGIAA